MTSYLLRTVSMAGKGGWRQEETQESGDDERFHARLLTSGKTLCVTPATLS
nr:MAG TPA_asm: hypothetical protein [Caudoviricetes sp.]